MKRSIREVSDAEEPLSVKRRFDPNIALPIPRLDDPPKRPPPFQQPSQLTTFSYVSEISSQSPNKRIRTLKWNNASMKYFVPPPSGANLAHGYERWIKRPEERGRLDTLLEACMRNECEMERRRANVITWRGVITKILTAPYEDRDGWQLNVMSINGTLYLEEHLTEEKLQEKSNISGRQRLMTYYGYCFESYCTADIPPDPHRPPNPNNWGGDVDTNAQWCSIVKTKLGPFRMLIGGEVDCVRDRYTGQPDTFMELKTSISIRPTVQSDSLKFERKLLKFYFQSFILGVPEILVGFRSPSGILQTTQSFKTMDIPRLIRGKPDAWEPSICLNWGDRVFGFLEEQTKNSRKDAVWRLTFAQGSGLSFRMLNEKEVEDVVGGEARTGFLPTWYWDQVTKPELDDNVPSASDIQVRPQSLVITKPLAPSLSTDGPKGWEL